MQLRLAASGCVVLMLAGCSHGSGGRSRPDLAGFLRLPVATPTACAGKQAGSTVGRKSPWVGTVDVSVFLAAKATSAVVQQVGDELRSLPAVATIYYESAAEAYAEFQRLYTCSADVPPSALPPSYRLILKKMTRPARDDLVRQIRKLDGVASVSCDPSSPCLPDS
jgi:hypothetical protein